MINEMVERVARAMCAVQYPGLKYDVWEKSLSAMDKDELLRQARAAIAAMREPAEAMKSSEDACWDWTCYTCGGPRHIWETYIKEALKEEE